MNQIMQTPKDLQYPNTYPKTRLLLRKVLQPTASRHRIFFPFQSTTSSLPSKTASSKYKWSDSDVDGYELAEGGGHGESGGDGEVCGWIGRGGRRGYGGLQLDGSTERRASSTLLCVRLKVLEKEA
jgi:hypothetical protein